MPIIVYDNIHTASLSYLSNNNALAIEMLKLSFKKIMNSWLKVSSFLHVECLAGLSLAIYWLIHILCVTQNLKANNDQECFLKCNDSLDASIRITLPEDWKRLKNEILLTSVWTIAWFVAFMCILRGKGHPPPQ